MWEEVKFLESWFSKLYLRILFIWTFCNPNSNLLKLKKKKKGIDGRWKERREKNLLVYISFSSVQFSHSVVSTSLRPHGLQHARPPCPSPTPGVYSDSCPLSQWYHPSISSSVVPFSSCPQSLPASESFPMSQLFAWGGQSTGVSASASAFSPSNEYSGQISFRMDWLDLLAVQGTLKSLLHTTVQKHQFFGAQLSL